MVAHALGVPSNAVEVNVRRMGGGFGGKESQMNLFACVAAIAAKKLRRPVKLRPDRDQDMMITGTTITRDMTMGPMIRMPGCLRPMRARG